MLVLIAIILTVVPALIILYPLVKRVGSTELLKDESSLTAELHRRWDSVVAGLRTAELELSIGNLSEEDYLWIKNTYAKETAQIMEAMGSDDGREISIELHALRERGILGRLDNGEWTMKGNK